ncbi:MAG TPA: hypothetical protein VIK18_13010, partial [Pirellulales bacterium]
ATDFHDSIGGNNGLNTAPGYDLVTGRGSPLVNLVVQGLGAPTPSSVLNVNGDADFAGENDSITLELNAFNPSLLDVYFNSATPIYEAPLASISQINVNGLLGNDTLIVDDSNGLVSMAGGIHYDGGAGSNALALLSSGGATQTSDAFNLGGSPNQGTDAIIGSTGTQTIAFQNSGSVLDTAAAATLSINGAAADATIAYGQGSIVSRGLLTIVGQQALEFANKSALIINASTNDQITLDNPYAPAALAQIVVEPAASATGVEVTIGGAIGPVAVSMAAGGTPGAFTQLTGYSTSIALAGLAIVDLDAGGKSLAAATTSLSDTILVGLRSPQSGYFQSAALSTMFKFSNMGGVLSVEGGPGSDTLAIESATGGTLAANQFVVTDQSSSSAGTIEIYTGGVLWTSVNYQNVQSVQPNVASDGSQPNALFMGPDQDESNDSLVTATSLGSGTNIQVASVAISSGLSPGQATDVDFYSVVAQQTGTLDLQALFSVFDPALLPGGGILNLQAFDAAGDLIATASSGPETFGATGADGDARLRIPAVAGQTYYLEVFGANTDGIPNPGAINGYSLNIENTASPVPYDLQLSPDGLESGADDTGGSSADGISNINTPTIYLQLDDSSLLHDSTAGDAGAALVGVIPIPFASDGTVAGFSVAIFDGQGAQQPVGFATPVGAAYPGLYQYTFATLLADGTHSIYAALEMVDLATPAGVGFGSQSSAVLELTIDTAPPTASFGNGAAGVVDGLAPGSDSGIAGQPQTLTDGITNVTLPSLFGFAET